MLDLASSCPRLCSLKARCRSLDHTPRALQRLALACPSLMKLNLKQCGDTYASRASLEALADHCPLLRDVNLSWSNACDGGVGALAKKCASLELLDLVGCKALTPGLRPHLLQSTSLSWVDLSWVDGITDRIAGAMVGPRPQGNPRLCVVDYYGEFVRGDQYQTRLMNRRLQEKAEWARIGLA